VTDLHVERRFDDLRGRIDGWLDGFAATNPLIVAIERGTSDETRFGEPRWYVRMAGEEKESTTVWLTLGQRTLRYETYVLPDPPRRRAEILELLMRRNDQLTGAHFSIGAEDAIYLRGEIADAAVTEEELDRVLGTLYTAVEADFRTLVHLAFTT
jgi:hypothetical protein